MKEKPYRAKPKPKTPVVTTTPAPEYSPHFRTVIGTACTSQLNRDGFQLSFGTWLQDSDGVAYSFLEVCVGMSPENASDLVKTLQRQLEQYVVKFGRLRLEDL